MNASAMDRYATWELDALVSSISPAFRFLSTVFFGRTRQFEGQFVEWDIVEGGRRVAPFVSPMQNGRPTRRLGYRTFQLRPAYIKLSDTVRPEEGFTRLPGEPYGGQLSPMERIDARVAEQIATHLDMIANRLEIMARDCLVDASITITGEGYPTSVVDFERNANNAATVGTVWSDGNSTPLADIQAHATTMNKTSRGAVVNSLVMAGSVFDVLTTHQDVRDLVNRDKNLSPGTTAIEFGPRSGSPEATWRGRLAGQYDLWTYDGYYEDDTGTSQPLMPANKVVFAANQGPNSGMEGGRYNGAIIDMDAGVQPREVFVKARNLWDPSGVEVLTQSAPMIGMRRPNATGTLTVL